MRNYLYLTTLAASLVAIASPATAQQGLALEEIVVTARKREENLQEVPVSISVLNAELIRDAGIIDPRDIFELAPGIDYDVNHDRISAAIPANAFGMFAEPELTGSERVGA